MVLNKIWQKTDLFWSFLVKQVKALAQFYRSLLARQEEFLSELADKVTLSMRKVMIN